MSNFMSGGWKRDDAPFPYVSRVSLNKFHLSFKGIKKVCYPAHWIIDFTYSTNSFYMIRPVIKKWRRRMPMEFHIYSPGMVFFERDLKEKSDFSISVLISNGDALGLAALCEAHGFAVGHDREGKLGEMLSKIAGAYNSQGESGFWAAQSLLFSATDYLNGFTADENGILKKKEDVLPEFPEQVIAFLKKNIAGKLTLDQIARRFGMSESSLSHRYSTMTGESVMRIYMSLRLGHAALLVEYGERLDSVAEKTGFCSAFNFSRQFKKYFGVSPSAYRKNVH